MMNEGIKLLKESQQAFDATKTYIPEPADGGCTSKIQGCVSSSTYSVACAQVSLGCFEGIAAAALMAGATILPFGISNVIGSAILGTCGLVSCLGGCCLCKKNYDEEFEIKHEINDQIVNVSYQVGENKKQTQAIMQTYLNSELDNAKNKLQLEYMRDNLINIVPNASSLANDYMVLKQGFIFLYNEYFKLEKQLNNMNGEVVISGCNELSDSESSTDSRFIDAAQEDLIQHNLFLENQRRKLG